MSDRDAMKYSSVEPVTHVIKKKEIDSAYTKTYLLRSVNIIIIIRFVHLVFPIVCDCVFT